MKPTRIFTADEGHYSTGLSGPDAIEKDIDTINKMFDPFSQHENGDPGGISAENIRDNSITDNKLGNIQISDTTSVPYSNSGYLRQIISWFAKVIRIITGEENWHTAPIRSLKQINTDVTNALDDVADALTISNKASTDSDQALKNSADSLTRINNWVDGEPVRQTTFLVNEVARTNTFNQGEVKRTDTFNTAENARNTKVDTDTTLYMKRMNEMLTAYQFKATLNIVDYGEFRDARNIAGTIDCGQFGEVFGGSFYDMSEFIPEPFKLKGEFNINGGTF